MDTKLKKTHKKLKVTLIILAILVPALVLVGFYERLEKLANEKINGSYEEETVQYFLAENFMMDCLTFTNNAYNTYVYDNGYILEEDYIQYLNSVLDKNSIIDDLSVSYVYKFSGDEGSHIYNSINQAEGYSVDIMAQKILEEGYVLSYEEMEAMGIAAYYYVEIDEYGVKKHNDFYTYELEVEPYYNYVNSLSWPGDYVEAVFFLPYESSYVGYYTVHDWYSQEHAYYDIGAPILIVVAAVLVALVALLLPFVKSLNTGNEKIFRMPAEIVIMLMGMVIAAMVGMFFVMSYTNLNFWQMQLSDSEEYILGYRITANVVYKVLICLNALAWALCFFVEYIVVTSLRQFIAHPIKYIKERSLIIKIAGKIFKWIKTKVKKLWIKIKDVVVSLKPNKLLVLVLAINLVVAAIACIFRGYGIILFIIYTVVVYLLVYKKYLRERSHFNAVKDAICKMSEGDFDISIGENSGVFQPIAEELVKVKDGFEKAIIEEAKSERMKTELITNVSHDLKTPLTAIITYVDLLKKENITEDERQQYIETLDMKSQRLKVLIEDLFEVSKANSGNVSMNLMDVDVVGLLKQVRLELEDKISAGNVDFRWNLPDEKVILKLDGQKTYRIFANLINNIVKYSLGGSRAFVDVANSDSKVIITFKNISANEIECDVSNLTERFVRGDASRNSEGSGLGLAIVKSFVELQGGSFNIEVDGDLFKAVIEWGK